MSSIEKYMASNELEDLWIEFRLMTHSKDLSEAQMKKVYHYIELVEKARQKSRECEIKLLNNESEQHYLTTLIKKQKLIIEKLKENEN